jgi:carbonic anhydrase/SulP family sulfate permease
MSTNSLTLPSHFRFSPRDLRAGLVVFLVALPLCLGVALASDAPLFSGIVSGVIGGLVIGFLSGSHTSISGPAAGLTAIVASQIATLGSFPAFLTAVFLGGVIQIALGLAQAGFIASFFPSTVIKGLLAAIGIILILKQTPHLLGHDVDPVGRLDFAQEDGENTVTELLATMFDIQPGAALVGLLSLGLLVVWSRVKLLKDSGAPVPLVVVLLGAGLNTWWQRSASPWTIGPKHLVQVPVAENLDALSRLLVFPDWSVLARPAVYGAALTVALVASLETLLNLEAVDRIDPMQRHSPPNRELIAQGAGNMLAGLFGGLPMTSVIVRSSVNISARNRSRYSAIFHGVLLLGSVLLVPHLLNRIPLASLAAILFVTGLKLASPKLFRQMWSEGRRQFLPFSVTVITIVMFNLLTGIVIGLVVSVFFILYSNFRRPLSRTVERLASGDVLRIELANQVSFFSRAALERAFYDAPNGGHVLIDARNTNYIDPDILDLIHDFRTDGTAARNITLSFVGFKERYPELADNIKYVEHTNTAVQRSLTSADVLTLLQQGNDRFQNGEQLTRDLRRQMSATAPGQAPLAVALSCMDSRAPVELLFDLGIGDVFSVRVAGNVVAPHILGSLEYGCVVAGAKLLLVLGHTSCGAVTAAVNLRRNGRSAAEATGCVHIDYLVEELGRALDQHSQNVPGARDEPSLQRYIDSVTRTNVVCTMDAIRARSTILDRQLREEKLRMVGGLYDLRTGHVEFFDERGRTLIVSPGRNGDATRVA